MKSEVEHRNVQAKKFHLIGETNFDVPVAHDISNAWNFLDAFDNECHQSQHMNEVHWLYDVFFFLWWLRKGKGNERRDIKQCSITPSEITWDLPFWRF